jgi:hypothetical protein
MGADEAARAPVLRRLAAEGASCFGAPVERIRTERIIRRAFSEVLRARVHTGRGEIVVYCKTFCSPPGDPTSLRRSSVCSSASNGNSGKRRAPTKRSRESQGLRR